MKNRENVKFNLVLASVIFVLAFVGLQYFDGYGVNASKQSNDNENSFVGCATPSFTSLSDITDVRLPTGMVLADFNRDGKLDLVTSATGSSTSSVSVRFGNSDGSFQLPAYYAAGSSSSEIGVGDFDDT